MRKLLNVLYVSTQGAYLSQDGETVVISLKSERLAQLPMLNLQGIVCFGNVLCSPFLLGKCAENGIAVSFLTANGRFLARVQGGVCGNILLRKAQFRYAESEEESLKIAKYFLLAKLLNSRTGLQRFLRDHAETLTITERDIFDRGIVTIKTLAEQVLRGDNLDSLDALRGKEGYAADLYFSCFPYLITSKRPEFEFTTRNRRPPVDRVNAMLSFAYTLLAHDCAAALESVGLDPAAGFLHADRPGRASLALDLMEEFRVCLADRLVLSLINLNRITPKDFKITETGAVRMNDDTRKIFINAWQTRKQEDIIHPFLKEKIKVGMLPFVQSLLLARFIRGDTMAYAPFVWR